MWAIGLMGLGLAASAAGSFVGAGIMRGDRMYQPSNPVVLQIAVVMGCAAAFAGAVGGFVLFGWYWLAALALLFVIGFGLAIDGLNSAGRDRLPAVAMIAVAVGAIAQMLAVLAT